MAYIEEKYGPKMAKLTPMRRAFVLNIMAQGDRNATRAAKDAGYSEVSPGSLRVQAHNLWHNEDIQEAIHEEATRRLKGLLPMAVNTIATIMENPQEGGAVRLKAAHGVMDRAGIHAVTEKISTPGDLAGNPDRVKRIMALAHALRGVPLEKFLSDHLTARPQPVITEATYVEMSTEGLEDLTL